MSRSVFCIPVGGKWLIHAPLHGLTALVNDRAAAALTNGGAQSGGGPLATLRDALTDDPSLGPRRCEGDVSPDFLGLIPTRACNMSCVYCAFGAASAAEERMELDMAVAAVDWMAAHQQRLGRETLEVHFFGGEPFCAGEVVDVAVHRGRMAAAQRGMTPIFEVATNGFFDEDRARFVGDYFDTVVLSLDGFPEAHDRHRPVSAGCGSFETVARTADVLSSSPVELCFRVCVSDYTVTRLEEIARWFCDKFRPSVVNFEVLQRTAQSDQAGLSPPDPWQFAAHCVRACRVVRELGVQPVYAAATAERPRLTFCPVANDTIIVSPDGRVSACYLPDSEWQSRGLDLDIGWLEADGSMRLDRQAVNRVRRLITDKPRCEHCFCQWSCAGGCHVNNTYPGCPDTYDDFCIQTRVITGCLLLDDLGHHKLVDTMLADRAMLEALALRPSDCLEDWNEADGC